MRKVKSIDYVILSYNEQRTLLEEHKNIQSVFFMRP